MRCTPGVFAPQGTGGALPPHHFFALLPLRYISPLPYGTYQRYTCTCGPSRMGLQRRCIKESGVKHEGSKGCHGGPSFPITLRFFAPPYDAALQRYTCTRFLFLLSVVYVSLPPPFYARRTPAVHVKRCSTPLSTFYYAPLS